jgi:hypothetical protein
VRHIQIQYEPHKENKKKRGGGGKSHLLNEKKNEFSNNNWNLLEYLTLYKYDPDAYMIYHIRVDIYLVSGTKKMRIWSNGKISLCQGEDAGSSPAIRPW